MKLFISYSHDDKSYVEVLAAALADEDAQHHVWYDRRLFGGQKWWDKILEEIEVCECFIPIIMPRSLTSIYCEAELNYAMALNKPLLPFKLKPCDVPRVLADVYQIDDIQGVALERVVKRTLSALLDTQARIFRGMHKPPNPAPLRPPLPTPRVPVSLPVSGTARKVDLAEGLREIQSQHTKRAYTRWLRDLMGLSRADQLLQVGLEALADRLKGNGFTTWMRGVNSRGIAPASVAQARAAVIWAAQLLFDQGFLDADILARMRGTKLDLSNRVGKPLLELSPQQIRHLLHVAGKPHRPGSALYLRNRAIIFLMIMCGLGREELAALNWGAMHLGNSTPYLAVAKKGTKPRSIPVPHQLERAILAWRDSHPFPHPTRPVFTRVFKGNTASPDRLIDRSIWLVVRETAKHAGLRDISPQVIRRSFVRASYAAGVPLETLRDVLGHSTLAATERLLADAKRRTNSRISLEDWGDDLLSSAELEEKSDALPRQLPFLD